ncbi:GNAT family N-acetyltransferase [Lysinibacillus sp. NPDC097287]|uniref:GNAT family N-acetyltransferase n=1 Tax=Lysinibacillus sp. NPDC097287 TaxID=3364144 RepID=UPI003810247E
MIKLQIIRIQTVRELLLYKGFWDGILEAEQNDNPFIEFAWFHKWWQIVGANERVVVYAVKKDNDIIGFFPFSIKKKLGTNIFSLTGSNIANYSGFVVKKGGAMQAVSFVFDEILKRHRHVLFLFHGLLESGISSQVIERYFVERQSYTSIFRTVTPYLAYGQTDFLTLFNARKKMHGLDGQEKKLRNLGSLSGKTSEQTELWQMFKLFDRCWSQKMDTSGFTVGKKKDFFEQLALVEGEALQVEVDSLVFENQWIAFTYGICCRGRYVTYAFGHEPNFNLFGAGSLANQETMKRIFLQGYKVFDLSIGYAPYKFDWYTDIDFTRKVLVSGETKRAKLLHMCLATKERAKEILKSSRRIVEWKRNVLGQWRYLVKRGHMKDWLHYTRKLFGKIFNYKYIDLYELAGSSSGIPLRPVGQLYEEMPIQEAMQLEHDNLIALFYKGYTIYKDCFAKTSKRAFAMHSEYWRIDALQIVERLPKNTYFLAHDDSQNIEVTTAFFQKIKPTEALWVTASFWQWRKRKRLQKLGYKRISHMKLVKCGRFERSQVKNLSENGGGIHSIN